MTQTHGVGTPQLLNAALDPTGRAGAGRTSPKAETAGKETTATLSGTGSLLAASATFGDDVRTDRVASLKLAIDNGTYHVPAAAVADKIIGNLLG